MVLKFTLNVKILIHFYIVRKYIRIKNVVKKDVLFYIRVDLYTFDFKWELFIIDTIFLLTRFNGFNL